MNQLSICAVVPAYNRAHLIVEALDSIVAQTCLPNEIIVVDDGSTDDTVAVVNEWGLGSKIALKVIEQANGGAASARNTAIANTEADLIAPLDSDDVWVPDHLETLLKPFLQHEDVIVSSGNTERLDDLPMFKKSAYGEEIFKHFDYEQAEDGFRYIKGSAFPGLLKGAFIQTSSCVFRRQSAVEVGFFDDSLRSYEDQLFFLRLSRLGRFAVHMDPVTLLRRHDDNTTHRRHIASHIVCAISALEKARADVVVLQLDEAEIAALQAMLDRKVNGAVSRASRYGWRPYWDVCRALASRGYWQALADPKSMARAILRPQGEAAKRQSLKLQSTESV